MGDKNFLDYINPSSLEIRKNCKIEKSVEGTQAPMSYQFMRLGYFCIDKDSTPDAMIFNRSVALKDGFKKK